MSEAAIERPEVFKGDAVEDIANLPKMTMGTDPEFFITRHNEPVPAFDHLPDKHSTQNGLFWDGFQAETVVDIKCNAVPECHATVATTIGNQLAKVGELGLGILPSPVWRVPDRLLEVCSEAQVALGCDVSRNAYRMGGRCVEEPRRLKWRFAGGHIHFALPPEERNNPDHIRYVVKTLDAFVGVPTVALAQNYDHFIRRRYYGLAGEYRLPPHGLEWRTLSNFWLMDPRAYMLVFDLARHALWMGRKRLKHLFVGSEEDVRNCINYCDVRQAKDLMQLNRDFYDKWNDHTYGHKKVFNEAIKTGIDQVIPKWGKDVVKAWHKAVGNWSNWDNVPTWGSLG